MKPKSLKSPFTWENRTVLIHDRVWYVPGYYDRYEEFVFPGWEHSDLFGNSQPVHVEYCSGNGAWIVAKAQQHPEFNWVAVEKKFERVRKIWSKIKNLSLNNLVVVCGEAMTATKNYFPDSSISGVYINFPDPWPKTRHAKYRLIQHSFVEQLERILVSNACLTLVTDDIPYSEEMIEVLGSATGFTSQFPSPYYVNEYDHYGTSYFEELWRSQGKEIRYHCFQKWAAT